MPVLRQACNRQGYHVKMKPLPRASLGQ